jgi:hypothetical protein
MLTVRADTITDYDMVISGTIAGLLKVRRSTVDQLAACTGITRATLYRKLRDGRWNANETGTIADQFGVDVADLYHGHITPGPALGTVTREYRTVRSDYCLAA